MAKAGENDPDSAKSQMLREKALAELSDSYCPDYRLDGKWWALKDDGSTCQNAADLSRYVWANRKSNLTDAQRENQAQKEIDLLQKAEGPPAQDTRLNPFPFLDSLHDLQRSRRLPAPPQRQEPQAGLHNIPRPHGRTQETQHHGPPHAPGNQVRPAAALPQDPRCIQGAPAP